jgi:putative copper resistance protein D
MRLPAIRRPWFPGQPGPAQVLRRAIAPTLLGGAFWAAAAGPAAAHGPVPADAPSAAGLLLGWSFEPAIALPLLGAGVAWWWLVRRVNADHPGHPVPRRRSAVVLGGLLAIAFALQSGIERYDTALFSIHMVQHLLLTMVAAPLLVLGAPITLVLRAASRATRRRWILPVLHSRALRLIGHPVVAGLLFAAVMWGAHFSPLFDLALEDRLAHDIEHVAFLATALLFWWPALSPDPAPYRLSHPARIIYTFLQMPQNTFLAVAISFAPAPLYPHYATLARSWGPDALLDQQIAGAIMWVGGDLLFLVAILGLVVAWARAEEREGSASERRADAQRVALRAREAAFAARRAGTAGATDDLDSAPAPGAGRAGHGPAIGAADQGLDATASEGPGKSPLRGR